MAPAAWLALAGLLGAVVGSFLNVVAHRLPRGESIVRPRSRCPHCGAPVAARDNIPVLSWLLLRARCRACGAPISPRYPLVEAATALLFAAVAWRYGPTPDALLWMAFGAALVTAALIDFDHRIIPDEISLGGLAAGLVLVPLVRLGHGTPLTTSLGDAALGALLGGGLLWLVGFLHARVSVALGRSFEHWPGEGAPLPRPASLDYWVWFPGLGFGDVKLLAMIGAFVGPAGVLETILLAALSGLALGVVSALATRRWDAPFGFGPAIALGAIGVVLLPIPLF